MVLFTRNFIILYNMGSNNKLYYLNPIQQPLFEEDDDGNLIEFRK